MKKLTLTLSTLSILSMSLSPAFANEGGDGGPCKKIREACVAAGFTAGGHKDGNKGLHMDCIKKIMDGETVAGVTVPADEVAACKAKKDKRKEKHEAKKEEKAAG